MWKLLAKFLSRDDIATALIVRSKRTPFIHLPGYMERFWLFNRYDLSPYNATWFPWSIRVHHILRADLDRHLHDHPWNARTVILKGWYVEERLDPSYSDVITAPRVQITRRTGDTARLRYGEFHRITQVSEGGVWTLFITGRYRGTWGFRVAGVKVPHREYKAKQHGALYVDPRGGK